MNQRYAGDDEMNLTSDSSSLQKVNAVLKLMAPDFSPIECYMDLLTEHIFWPGGTQTTFLKPESVYLDWAYKFALYRWLACYLTLQYRAISLLINFIGQKFKTFACPINI